MGATAEGVAAAADEEQRIDAQDIFDRVGLVLAALTGRLCRRVWGADDAPLGAIMGTRGDAGAAVGTAPPGVGASSASGVTPVAASAPEPPKRCAKAVRERAGASPRARRAVSKAGPRTWIH